MAEVLSNPAWWSLGIITLANLGSLVAVHIRREIRSGHMEADIDTLKKSAHIPPCPIVQEMRGDLREIKVTMEWMKRKNGGS